MLFINNSNRDKKAISPLGNYAGPAQGQGLISRTTLTQTQTKTQPQRNRISFRMVTVGRMDMPVVLVFVHVNDNMTVSIGLMRMRVANCEPILQVRGSGHMHHANTLGLGRFVVTLLIFIVAVYQEI